MDSETVACPYCAAQVGPGDVDMWAKTVNVTQDLLAVETSFFQLEDQAPGDGGFSWCNVDCFTRWCLQKASAEAMPVGVTSG